MRGFLRLGGVRCWYGWPIRRASGKPDGAKAKHNSIIIGPMHVTQHVRRSCSRLVVAAKGNRGE